MFNTKPTPVLISLRIRTRDHSTIFLEIQYRFTPYNGSMTMDTTHAVLAAHTERANFSSNVNAKTRAQEKMPSPAIFIKNRFVSVAVNADSRDIIRVMKRT